MPIATRTPSMPKAALKRNHDLQERRLDALAQLVDGPIPVPGLSEDAVGAALNGLADSMVIQFIGPRAAAGASARSAAKSPAIGDGDSGPHDRDGAGQRGGRVDGV